MGGRMDSGKAEKASITASDKVITRSGKVIW